MQFHNRWMNFGKRSGRRGFFGRTLSGVLGGTFLAAHSSQAGAGEVPQGTRRRLAPEGAPAADVGYSPGILAEGGRVLFVSGQGPADLKADMETQVRQTFERIGEVLTDGGATFADVVLIRSYFVHIERDLPAFRRVRLEFLVEPYPASTALGVPALAIPDLEIEIEAVAVLR